MPDPQKPDNVAPSSGEPGTPTTQPTTPTVPKLEVKDGNYIVEGKKYVLESDLIAAKSSLQKQLNDAQGVHSTAIDTAKLELSDAHKNLATANAALEEAKKASIAGVTSTEEVTRIKQENEASKTSLTASEVRVLQLRRDLIRERYHITPDSELGQKLVDKDMTALDSLEEALKALGTKGGGGEVGNYAVNAGPGGATPQTPMDRATAILASTPIRGVRNAPP